MGIRIKCFECKTDSIRPKDNYLFKSEFFAWCSKCLEYVEIKNEQKTTNNSSN